MNTKPTTASLVEDAKFYMSELCYSDRRNPAEAEQALLAAGHLASVAYELGERGYRQSFIDLCMARATKAVETFNA